MKKIRLLVSDIDGVLTDGRVMLHCPFDGKTSKSLCFKDFDAVSMFRSIGIDICFVTGEDDSFVDEVVKRFKPLLCVRGCKNKEVAINDIVKKYDLSIEEIAYVGDGKYDIPAIEAVGFGACPNDAIKEVRDIADIILDVNGGYGCIASLYTIIKKYNSEIKE